MKKVYIVLLSLAVALVLTGCNEKEVFVYETASQPSIVIEQLGESGCHDIAVRFTVSDNGAGFTYGIGMAGDRTEFENGTLATNQRVEGGGNKEVVIEGLDHMTEYTVFARAFDADNNVGPVAQTIIVTAEDIIITNPLAIELQYITSTSAALIVEPDDNYWKFDYALGTTGDRAAFEAGTLESIITQEQDVRFVISYFEINPATDYVFYIKAYDRKNKVSETMEIPVRTYAAGTVPGVSMSITTQDFYSGSYSFDPNSETGQYGVLVSEKGKEYAPVFYSKYTFNGDIMAKMLEYLDGPSWGNPMTMGDGSSVNASLTTPGMLLDAGLEAWIYLCDKNGDPFGIEKIHFSTPSFNDNAGTAKVDSFEFTEISTWYCPFTFSVNSNTVMTFIGVWDDPEEFEAALASSDNDGMCELNFEKSYNAFSSSYTFFYGNTSYNSSIGANTGKYYIGFTPVNANGPYAQGWGEFYYVELIVP